MVGMLKLFSRYIPLSKVNIQFIFDYWMLHKCCISEWSWVSHQRPFCWYEWPTVQL